MAERQHYEEIYLNAGGSLKEAAEVLHAPTFDVTERERKALATARAKVDEAIAALNEAIG